MLPAAIEASKDKNKVCPSKAMLVNTVHYFLLFMEDAVDSWYVAC